MSRAVYYMMMTLTRTITLTFYEIRVSS